MKAKDGVIESSNALKKISLMFYFPKLLIINVSFQFLGMTSCLSVMQCDLDSPLLYLEHLHSKLLLALLSLKCSFYSYFMQG